MFMISSDRLDEQMRCRENDPDRAAAGERLAEAVGAAPVQAEPHRFEEQ
jgi:hypothetical protein